MVSVKERRIKGRTYVYLSTTASYKGRKKWFEKMIGPKGMDRAEYERKVEFHSELLNMKKEFYEIILKTKYSQLEHIPQGYSFFLTFISSQYDKYLSSLYPPELEKYTREFEVRYVNSTTALEGNTLTLRETGLVLTEGIAPVNKKLREIHEVENYEKVLDLIKTRTKDIDRAFILELHELIMRNIDDESAGTFRRGNVKIVGSRWEPPQGVVVEDEVKILLDWYKENRRAQHPLELAGMFHLKFLQIHPFADGNGRVGRELLNFILKRNGYPMLIIPVEQRQAYLESLETADNGEPGPLLEFFTRIMIKDYFSVAFNFLQSQQEELSKDLEGMDEAELAALDEFVFWFFQETAAILGELKGVQLQDANLLGILQRKEL